MRRGRVAGILACAPFGAAPDSTLRASWRELAARYRAPLLIDSAPGFGAIDEFAMPLGTQGETELVSFHATKPFAIGEGGAVTTPDPEVAARIGRIVNFGIEPSTRTSTEPGFNGKLSELHAATGPHGLACIAPEVRFVGADVAFDGDPAPSMVPVVLEPGPELPFCDDAFDTVLCLDVLEHVPPAQRAPFLHELARVAARRVVLACPTDAGVPLDDLLRAARHAAAVLARRARRVWPADRRRARAPAGGALRDRRLRCAPLAMPNDLLCSMIVLADCDPATAPAARESFRRHGYEMGRERALRRPRARGGAGTPRQAARRRAAGDRRSPPHGRRRGPVVGSRPARHPRIPTWKGHERLVARTIPSILEGTYENVEVLVCSDGPDAAARAAVEALAARDSRVRYLELPERPVHPSHPWSFWETTGLRAANRALDEARGRFIAPLDHDDEFTATHIADLVGRARDERADLVHAQALCEQRSGPPTLVGREHLAHGHVCHGAVLYSARLAHMRYDTACWLLEEPGDWNMWRRMRELGARVAYLDRVVLLHTAERTSIEERVDDDTMRFGAARGAEDLAPDVLGTDAAWYLEVEGAAAPAELPA